VSLHCRDIWEVERLVIVEAGVLIAGDLLTDFGSVEPYCGGGYLLDFVHWWWRVLRIWHLSMERRWIEVVLVLLEKDLNSVLELCKSCSLCVDVLFASFGVLSYCLPPHDGFLFLSEPLDLLLDSNQLLFCDIVFESFIFPVFHLYLLEVYVVLDYLNRQRCPWG
jgi:hypothetical protein